MKTRRVAGIDLSADCFAYVGDPEKPETFSLPIHAPGNVGLTINFIKSSAFRVFSTKSIPVSERQKVLLTVLGAAKAYGIKVEPQPASAPLGGAHPNTAEPLDAVDVEAKAAMALAALAAERFLKTIGY